MKPIAIIGLIGLIALLVSCTGLDEPPPPRPTPYPTATAVPTATPVDAGLDRTEAHCTGSMSPAITCLDQILSRPDPTPAMILVGSIIRFQSCKERIFAHRVVQIREVGGQVYYQTKGDAVDQPDHCWVPHEDVRDLVVSVEKNAVPENRWLRDQMIAARAALRANPDDPDAIAAYHCWRRVARSSDSENAATHDC